MLDYRIRCEVVNIKDGQTFCSGLARVKPGESFVIGVKTPEGICAKAFAAIYPIVMSMRFTEENRMEHGHGFIEVTCPDGEVTYRLSRIK